MKGSGLENWHFSVVPIRPDGLLQRKGTVMTYAIHFGVSQKNTLDNILSDTRFPQYLQAFCITKIMAIMTRTTSLPCAIMQAMSELPNRNRNLLQEGEACPNHARHFKSSPNPNKFILFVLSLMSCYEFYRVEASRRRRIIILILISPNPTDPTVICVYSCLSVV
jgi:hypothetical protein